MNDLVEFAIERNCDRILHSERGLKYGDSVEKVVSDLNTADPAAPGMALLYY